MEEKTREELEDILQSLEGKNEMYRTKEKMIKIIKQLQGR